MKASKLTNNFHLLKKVIEINRAVNMSYNFNYCSQIPNVPAWLFEFYSIKEVNVTSWETKFVTFFLNVNSLQKNNSVIIST
jgi:hypothetical protein